MNYTLFKKKPQHFYLKSKNLKSKYMMIRNISILIYFIVQNPKNVSWDLQSSASKTPIQSIIIPPVNEVQGGIYKSLYLSVCLYFCSSVSADSYNFLGGLTLAYQIWHMDVSWMTFDLKVKFIGVLVFFVSALFWLFWRRGEGGPYHSFNTIKQYIAYIHDCAHWWSQYDVDRPQEKKL